jgi:hypothetical protein
VCKTTDNQFARQEDEFDEKRHHAIQKGTYRQVHANRKDGLDHQSPLKLVDFLAVVVGAPN